REERMSDAPVKKRKDSLTITVPIGTLQNGRTLISPDHAFDGLIWRLHVAHAHAINFCDAYTLAASIGCDGDGSSEMWRTVAKMQMSFIRKDGSLENRGKVLHSFASWKGEGNKCDLTPHRANYYHNSSITSFPAPIKAVVTIETNSESFIRRPILDRNSSISDVILVLNGQKFEVNCQDLSSQSSYFNHLFFRDFKESKNEEIEIKEANSEEFDEMLKMMYGDSTESITVEKATRYLKMADVFDLQIVKEQVETKLLSTDLISMHSKILIAEEHKLEILKSEILPLYKNK
ncbi:hypothetical protein PENTCL1PPCAC_13155, partial [Pristionchus entomophagus]